MGRDKMRVLIKNKKEVLGLIRSEGLSLRQLSSKLKINYWTLRNWFQVNSMTKIAFLKLIAVFPEIKKIAVYKELPDNWGNVKGGKISFRKRGKELKIYFLKKMWMATNITQNVKLKSINEDFCELYGIILGDGCLFRFNSEKKRIKYSLTITGNSGSDRMYYQETLVPLFQRLFSFSPSIYKRKDCNALRIDIRKKSLVKIFLELGFPLGIKKELKIPYKIKREGMIYSNRVIRGLFDTDGCFFSRKDEGYKYPHVKITSCSRKLCEEIKAILRKQDIPAYIHYPDVIVRGINNIHKWFKVIGSSHPVTLERYAVWNRTGQLLPKG